MKKQTFSYLVTLVIVVVTVFSFTACGTNDSKNQKETSETGIKDVIQSDGEKQGEGITIRLLTRWTGAAPGTAVLDEVIKKFEAKYPEITIQNESVNDSNAFNNQFKTDIASGNVADIIHWPGVSIMKEYAETEVFLDIEGLIEQDSDVKDNVDSSLINMMELSPVGVPGVYALPIVNQMEVFYYRKDLFEKAGIEGTPETWTEFFDACDKLLAIDVVPWSIGGSNSWRLVHMQTGLMYKRSGVEKAIDLGKGSAKWTDTDIVENIRFMQDLANKGYFGVDYAGIDYETEKARFVNGETAISFDGSWRVGELAKEGDDFIENVGTFRMPYFEDKPEFKATDIAYPSQLEIGGHLANEPEKLEYVWEFASMFVGKDIQEKWLYDISNIPVRTDITIDKSKLNPLIAEMLAYKDGEIEQFGSDCWAYNTEASLEVILGDALVGALNGMTAEEAAKQIQDNLDEVNANK